MIERRQRQLFLRRERGASPFPNGNPPSCLPACLPAAVAHFGVSFMGRQRRVHKYKSGPAHSCRNLMQMSIQKYDGSKVFPSAFSSILYIPEPLLWKARQETVLSDLSISWGCLKVSVLLCFIYVYHLFNIFRMP